MNQNDSDDMKPEVDFNAGVRGKYLARYRRWAGITSATGSVSVGITNASSSSNIKIVRDTPHYAFLHVVATSRTSPSATEPHQSLVR